MPFKWRVEIGVWEVVFFSYSKGNCIFFFQFPFWYISEQYKFDLCITAWRNGFGLQLSFYLSKRISLRCRYGFFCYTFTYFVPFGVIENRVTKIALGILMENVTIPVGLVDQFYFYMHQLIKAWLFENIIFELDYHDLVCFCIFTKF